MRAISFPKINLNKAKDNLKAGLTQLSKGGFQKIFNQIDQMGIKKGVDTMGIDKFITQCALLAAGSGAITGIGGISTMLIGVPLDMINLITQQFRVTMAVSYHNTGKYKLSFSEFFKIVASSLKVDAGIAMSKNIMEEVVEKLMINIGSKTAERLVPVVGAVVGGAANFMFIKRVAGNLKKNPSPANVIKI
ncbi:hypothetical protein MUGA111182_08660 [Mucilaginibacter galii]|uniref:EcsC family protein n=1 Tax=Mucilaginibacter galii TaxID=2005073 RepID=A0A917N092_9SPHI|nr:hypothetical protein [Mucilaginibacter galii]GGI49503.1 hypothetical protein GCM10011425_07150 [Mucilaginibacter galii]